MSTLENSTDLNLEFFLLSVVLLLKTEIDNHDLNFTWDKVQYMPIERRQCQSTPCLLGRYVNPLQSLKTVAFGKLGSLLV